MYVPMIAQSSHNAPLVCPRVHYLNEATSAWPLAPGVREAMLAAWDTPPAPSGRGTREMIDLAEPCRALLASLLHVPDPTRIVLTSQATMALNLAILGLPDSAFHHVVTTVAEHNSVLRPLRRRTSRLGGRLTIIGLTPDGAIDQGAWAMAMADDATLAVVNHASNVTGDITPARDLFAVARDAGAITLLDAAQTIGQWPVHPLADHADLVALSGHKALRGPEGTGALYVAPHLDLDQVFVGGTGVLSELLDHPTRMPMRLEAGTPAIGLMTGLHQALTWHAADGAAAAARGRALAETLRTGLRAIPGVTVYGSRSTVSLPIIACTLDGWETAEVGYLLESSFGIHCRAGLHCAPLLHAAIGCGPAGTIRFSVSGCTEEASIDAALAAVRTMVSCGS